MPKSNRRWPSRPTFRHALIILIAGLCIGRRGVTLFKGDVVYDETRTFPKTHDPPGSLFDPIKIPPRCSREKRRKVIDMTLINNELSSLELRLNELWNVVDVFYIVESSVPFKPGAPPKPLHLTNRWNDFARFHSKMVLRVIPPEISVGTGAAVDLKNYGPNFKIQQAQRDELWRVLVRDVHPQKEDLIVRADLDEVPRPEVIEKLACDPPGALPETPICLETKDSFYYYNYKCHIDFEWTGSPAILHYGSSGYEYGTPYRQRPCKSRIVNASTHCSSCFGTLDDYHVKSMSNSEPIRNPLLQTNNASILERVRSCKDFWLRTPEDKKMELRDSVDLGSIPRIVSKHPERWPYLMGEGPLYESVSYLNQTFGGRQYDNPQIIDKVERVEDHVPTCLTAQETCVHPYFPSPETVTCPVTSSPKASSTGAYILPKDYMYRFDRKFANALLNNVISGRVLELGAGLGCYTYYFRNSGKISHISGFEGASNVNELTGGFIKQADLTEEHNFGKFDWVVSLEVAEHIPQEFEAAFVSNIIANSPKGIVLSWALPDQPGSGHVNGKTNEYVISLMNEKGFAFDEENTLFLRSQTELGWFKDTTMVFSLKVE